MSLCYYNYRKRENTKKEKEIKTMLNAKEFNLREVQIEMIKKFMKNRKGKNYQGPYKDCKTVEDYLERWEELRKSVY